MAKIFYVCVIVGIAGCAVYHLLSERVVTLTSKAPLKDTRMAEVLTSEKQIRTLTEINGVPIVTIESRAEPHRSESFRGFLGPYGKDKLKNSLLSSWEWARKIGVTHIEIANILDDLCKKYQEKENDFCVWEILDLKVCFPQFKIQGEQPLKIRVAQYTDEHPIKDTDIFRQPGEVSKKNSYVEITIINLNTSAQVIWTPMRGEYIRKYGFYSLGIEFVDLMAVLTGKHIQVLIKKPLSR